MFIRASRTLDVVGRVARLGGLIKRRPFVSRSCPEAFMKSAVHHA